MNSILKSIPFLILVFILPFYSLNASQTDESKKPRIINMTDLGADPDDQQSMVRFLVQSNEFDVEGLIVTTSCWKKSQSNINMLNDLLNAYGEAVTNLQVHNPDFPSLEYLQSVSALGQRGYGMSYVGSGKDSPGSNLIISAVDKEDPRPVWICFWGGGNTLAQALWKVKDTRSASELKKFVSKIRVYDVLGQDYAGTWIAKNFPDMIYIRATGVYGWQPSDTWLKNNIQNHGPLGAVYPNRKYATEGDSPSFLHVFPNGLNNPDEVWQGGWGGRFNREKKAGIRGMTCMSGEDAQYDPYYMYGNTSAGASDISRWSTAYNNDFQARMDWSVTSNYSEANHHPVAIVNNDSTKQVIEISVPPGSTVNLSAEGSFDPDGDNLLYNWFYYKDPGTFSGSVPIQNNTAITPVVTVPKSANGKELHIVLELHDSGSPSLYAYRRVIFNVIDTTRYRVMISSDFPPFPVTNSDPDDVQSMVRFLLYTNEFDVEGLIASAGTFSMVAEKKNILAVLDKYDLVDENLRKHDDKFPTADALRNITFEGQGNNHDINIQWGCEKQPWSEIIGEGKDSEASDAIIAAVDKNDPRPLYIGVWGGPREIAQAIWKVQNTRTPEELQTFISKIRIFLIACQDATHNWLMDNFPELFIIESKTTYQGMFKVDNREWAETNIIDGHGPLCAIYPPSAMAGDGVIEGDSPSFLYLVSANRGINNPEDPTQASWGGQYVRDGSTNHYIDGPGKSTISVWGDDFQEEFMERADWCINKDGENNDNTDIWLEAECGNVGSLWNILSDDSASENKYISIEPGNNSLNKAPMTESGEVSFDIDIAKQGDFTFWARIKAPDSDGDSFWLGMDNIWWSKWDGLTPSANWIWVSAKSAILSEGTHTLVLGYREDGIAIDKFFLTPSDSIPSGIGAEANNCSNSTNIKLFPANENILIYPNPANNILNISLPDNKDDNGNLSIYNIQGEIIKYVPELKQSNKINTVGIKPGLYFIYIENGYDRTCKKIIIQ